jgi:transposase
MNQTIVLTVDYHDRNCSIRRRALDAGRDAKDRVETVPTALASLQRVVAEARALAGRAGRVVWIQESTTGWARVQTALTGRVDEFILANVLQMPRPPKGHRKKTDAIDTSRLQREFLNGQLPRSHQPPAWWREVRRLVRHRESLVSRRTAVRNALNRFLAHETWSDRDKLWSGVGRERLRTTLSALPALDAFTSLAQLDEVIHLEKSIAETEAKMAAVSAAFPAAQRIDAIRGIGIVSAVSIAARIGPVDRFKSAESLIAYAGLAPGVRQSDGTRHDGRIGGGGTDVRLRHYLIEATIWARDIPRWKPTYERIMKRRGAKIGRLAVARMMLRSIFKVLTDDVAFESESTATATATAGV